MKKVKLSELPYPVQRFLEDLKSGGSIAVFDDNDRLRCGITPYFRASDEERAAAWERIKAIQKEVGESMAKQGVTEEDVDRILQEDD